MGIKVNVNYPLLRDLRQMGILSSDAAPKLVGPFKVQTEAFTGDTSGATKTLAETPISGGIHTCVTIATAQGTANTLTALTEDTDFSVSGDVLTWLADHSANEVLLQYAY